MDITFRASLIMSVIIHSAVLGAMNDFKAMPRQEYNKKTIVVDYVKQEAIPELKKQERVSAKTSVATPQVYIPNKIIMAVQDISPSPSKAKEKPVKRAMADAAAKQAKLASSKDYISYNQIIRQKILSNLKRRYNERYEEGNVAVTFTLNSDGTFSGFGLDKAHSTSSSALVGIASSSIREASPFPPFPKGLSVPSMSFSLVIEFRKK